MVLARKLLHIVVPSRAFFQTFMTKFVLCCALYSPFGFGAPNDLCEQFLIIGSQLPSQGFTHENLDTQIRKELSDYTASANKANAPEEWNQANQIGESALRRYRELYRAASLDVDLDISADGYTYTDGSILSWPTLTVSSTSSNHPFALASEKWRKSGFSLSLDPLGSLHIDTRARASARTHVQSVSGSRKVTLYSAADVPTVEALGILLHEDVHVTLAAQRLSGDSTEILLPIHFIFVSLDTKKESREIERVLALEEILAYAKSASYFARMGQYTQMEISLSYIKDVSVIGLHKIHLVMGKMSNSRFVQNSEIPYPTFVQDVSNIKILYNPPGVTKNTINAEADIKDALNFVRRTIIEIARIRQQPHGPQRAQLVFDLYERALNGWL